ncbi:hypothetical protein HK097_010603 [Rhizophlyctis rosea]|uniref:Aldehyde dehydrogenase domain-containing protein n=1 Tax=Rhizophlyctis rosea TaxID=64517 RepID=A0AAD5SN58_9FUNG|nr:hypothetical protein HK097_010603 [Rhizophlyctis rosea]
MSTTPPSQLQTLLQAHAPQPLQNWIDHTHIQCGAEIQNENPPDPESHTKSDKFLPVTSPHDGRVVSYVPLSGEGDVRRAVESAGRAWEGWSNRTVKDRVQILMNFHQLVIKHADELADLIVLEHGKNRAEALAEIAKGNETVEYAISLPQLIQGKILEVSRGVHCHDVRKPLGVVASVVPFNFPFMVPMWTLPIAIATGNTMVLKPSEKVPLTMSRVMELLRDAGLPKGVVNLVHGTAEAVNHLIDHPDVKAVTFVGTTRIAEIVSKRCRNLNKRVIALGGAKNHLVSSPDCNIEMAAADIVNSFSGCSGQRCMAASVLLTIGSQHDLLDLIVRKASQLTPGSAPGHVGPVIDSNSQEKILRYINEAEQHGAKVLLDGRGWAKERKEGWWVGPTVLVHTDKGDQALRDEIFGPVLSVLECGTKEEAVKIENGNEYGNAGGLFLIALWFDCDMLHGLILGALRCLVACIYTQNGGVAEWFTKRFSAGMIGVNIGVPVPR